MQYLLLICGDETKFPKDGTPESNATMKAYREFTEMIQKMGVMKGGARLQTTSTATTVRIREGKTLLTDGPFAETKEQFGGFYLVDCKDLDQALELAAKIPGAKNGSIEVRPLYAM